MYVDCYIYCPEVTQGTAASLILLMTIKFVTHLTFSNSSNYPCTIHVYHPPPQLTPTDNIFTQPPNMGPDNPNNNQALVLPLVAILNASGAIIAWYLPDALTDTTQKEIREATDLLSPSLEKVLFNWGLKDVGATPGCINLSLAWFQQGHKNVSDPEVSASLKGPSCENILKAIARPAAITSTALRVMHPEQYWAGLRTLSNLGNIAVSKDLPQMLEALQYWASVFNTLSIISNQETPYH
ncbi:hypothetical protein BDR06DRAFT_1014217 [Suillus hirtellus]|nr:hypothetical protein BDR06DRAFT_1014217 [Suillus hirtellus]